jgi:hypothetical protein
MEDFIFEVGEKLAEEARKQQVKGSKHPRGGMAGQWGFKAFTTMGRLYNDADYASYWFEGRGAVTPTNKKFLHWVDPVTGADIFTKYSSPTMPHTEIIHVLDNWLNSHADKILQGLLNQD